MTLSILHRITGVASSVGFLVFAWWLMALASGPSSYETAMRYLSSPLGKLLLAGFTFSFVYHFCNGIRHMVWDTGRGLERAQARRSGWFVIVAALVLTALLVWSDARHRARGVAMSLRTPLGKVLGRGSAGDGTSHWWVQRVTAIALIPLTLWFVISILGKSLQPLRCHGRLDGPALGGCVHHPAGDHVELAFLAGCAGGHRGLRARQGGKTVLLLLSTFLHFAAAVAAIFAVLHPGPSEVEVDERLRIHRSHLRRRRGGAAARVCAPRWDSPRPV
jgi:succinate dehydrogenase / fumarate reductase cytochrome b subunit